MTACFLLLVSGLSHAQFFSNKTKELLPEDEAFQVITSIEDDVIKVNWVIAEDYYMYREQFRVESKVW